MLIKLSDLLGKFKNTLHNERIYPHNLYFFNKQGSSFIVFEDFADLFESEEQLIKEDPRLLGFLHFAP